MPVAKNDREIGERQSFFAVNLVNREKNPAFVRHFRRAREEAEKGPTFELQISGRDSSVKISRAIVETLLTTLGQGPLLLGEMPIDRVIQARRVLPLEPDDREALINMMAEILGTAQGQDPIDPQILRLRDVHSLFRLLLDTYSDGVNFPVGDENSNIRVEFKNDLLGSVWPVPENTLGEIKNDLFGADEIKLLALTGLIPPRILGKIPFAPETRVELEQVGLLTPAPAEFKGNKKIKVRSEADFAKMQAQALAELAGIFDLATIFNNHRGQPVSGNELTIALVALERKLTDQEVIYQAQIKDSSDTDEEGTTKIKTRLRAITKYRRKIKTVLKQESFPFDGDIFSAEKESLTHFLINTEPRDEDSKEIKEGKADARETILPYYKRVHDPCLEPDMKYLDSLSEPEEKSDNENGENRPRMKKETRTLIDLAFLGACGRQIGPDGHFYETTADLVDVTNPEGEKIPSAKLLLEALIKMQKKRAVALTLAGYPLTSNVIDGEPVGLTVLYDGLERAVSFGSNGQKPNRIITRRENGIIDEVLGEAIEELRKLGYFTAFNDDPAAGLLHYIEAYSLTLLDRIDPRLKDDYLDLLYFSSDLSAAYHVAEFAHQEGADHTYQDRVKEIMERYHEVREGNVKFCPEEIYRRSAGRLGESEELAEICLQMYNSVSTPGDAKTSTIIGASGSSKTYPMSIVMEELQKLAEETGQPKVLFFLINAATLSPDNWQGGNLSEYIVHNVFDAVAEQFEVHTLPEIIEIIESGKVRIIFCWDELYNRLIVIPDDKTHDTSSSDKLVADLSKALLPLFDPTAKTKVGGQFAPNAPKVSYKPQFVANVIMSSLHNWIKWREKKRQIGKEVDPNFYPDDFRFADLEETQLLEDIIGRTSKVINIPRPTEEKLMKAIDNPQAAKDRLKHQIFISARNQGLGILSPDDIIFQTEELEGELRPYLRHSKIKARGFRAPDNFLATAGAKAIWDRSGRKPQSKGGTGDGTVTTLADFIEERDGRRVIVLPSKIWSNTRTELEWQWKVNS